MIPIVSYDYLTHIQETHTSVAEASRHTRIPFHLARRYIHEPLDFWYRYSINGYAFMTEVNAIMLATRDPDNKVPWPEYPPEDILKAREAFSPRNRLYDLIQDEIELIPADLDPKRPHLWFRSIKEASEALGISCRGVSVGLSRQRNDLSLPCYSGYLWKRKGDSRPLIRPLEVPMTRKICLRPKVEKTKSSSYGIAVTVTPLESTGKWAVLHFPTIKEAAEDLDLNYRSVLSNLSGQRHKDTLPIFMGYYWQRSTDTRPFPRTT